MAFVQNTDANCEECITQANAWIGCPEADAEGNATGNVFWGEIPNVETIVEAIEESDATERRNSSTKGQFITPCSKEGRTRSYTITASYCPGFHPRCFGPEGAEVCIRLYKHKDASMNPTGEFREFKAKLLYPAIEWDNTTDDPELMEFTFEATSGVLEGGLPLCDATTPMAQGGVDNPNFIYDDATGTFIDPATAGAGGTSLYKDFPADPDLTPSDGLDN